MTALTRFLTLLLCQAILTLPSLAHSPLTSSQPENGETVKEAPSAILLQFKKPATLTVLSLEYPDGTKSKLQVDPRPATTEWSIPFISDRDGPLTVRWRALSADGHPVTGTFSFTLAR